MTRMLKVLVAGALLVMLSSATLRAQAGATAQLGGTVKDESGGVLPGVDISVTQTATGVTRSTVSDADGAYTLTNLPIGPPTGSKRRCRGSGRTCRPGSCSRSTRIRP